MRTPKEYSAMIKEGVVTTKVLGEVLFSINKRAKNWRDQKRAYKMTYYEKTYERAVEEEKKYYQMKSDILNLFMPICIHKDIKYRDKFVRVYDTAGTDEFERTVDYNGFNYNYIVKNSDKFNIKKYGSFMDWEFEQEVYFVDVIEETYVHKELFFNYFEIGQNKFHEPINEEEVKDSNLKIIVLDDFKTEGEDINDLLSTQFCKKVYDGIMNGELKIVD